MKLIVWFFIFISIFSSAFAVEGVYTVVIKKQEQKISNRWTLTDWLLTKRKVALMDQWLALNTSSPIFEFYLEGLAGDLITQRSDETTGGVTSASESYSAGLYIKFFGLSWKQEKIGKKVDTTNYQVNLMLLGSSLQSTNLSFLYGLRQHEHSDFSKFEQQYIGGSLTLYLLPFVGGIADYKTYYKELNDDNSYELSGKRIELSAFIDLFALRLKATYFNEDLVYANDSQRVDSLDKGWMAGASLFF